MLAPTYSAPFGVPSAMEALTAVFGMRTGVPLPLKHQHTIFISFKWFGLRAVFCNQEITEHGTQLLAAYSHFV